MTKEKNGVKKMVMVKMNKREKKLLRKMSNGRTEENGDSG